MLSIANHCSYHKAAARELVEQVRDYPLTSPVHLHMDDSQLTLCGEIDGQKTCFSHAFNERSLLRRASHKNQALIKACHSKKRSFNSALDLTAGWGRDSFLMAASGLQVTLLEQNELLYHCLQFLLSISDSTEAEAICQRMSLRLGNSLDYLQQQTKPVADIVYLDPMFPSHKSTAKPGKEMQLLQIITDNRDIDTLFDLALQSAGQRIVVKRPLHAPVLNQLEPDFSYREKTIRFDVYLPR